MGTPRFEFLEVRTLLCTTILPAGQAALFDFNADGAKEGVLVNSGEVDIKYTYTAGRTGLDRVDLLADGAAFQTNMWIGKLTDRCANRDFAITDVDVGAEVVYNAVTYLPVTGTTDVLASTIDSLTVGAGSLGSVCADAITGVVAAPTGQIVKLAVDDISGAVEAASFGSIHAQWIGGGAVITIQGDGGQLVVGLIDGGNAYDGSTAINGAVISIGGNLTKLDADTITGNTQISIGGDLQQLRADTISAGENAGLGIAVGGSIEKVQVGLLEGGQAVGDYNNEAITALSVGGSVGLFQAGLLSGGSGSPGETTAGGSLAILTVAVGGDVAKLRVGAITGGQGTGGGGAMLDFSVYGDILDAKIGEISGSSAAAMNGTASVGINAGHDIRKLVVGEINGGPAVDNVPTDYFSAGASVGIYAGNDILELAAHRISGGTASGEGAWAGIAITAGRDIDVITANTFEGGTAVGTYASADVYVQAMRNINFIGAGLISGTARSHRPNCDPTVQFYAGGNIGAVVAGRITGGTVTSDGVSAALAAVLLRADGTYVDPDTGEDVVGDGNIGAIYTGTIRGGTANGADALAYVNISAAGDINRLYADTISGGLTTDGGTAYVSILAQHDIVDMRVGTILGSENPSSGCDPAVTIQAWNSIKSLLADRIIAGEDGTVNILAGQWGVDENGNPILVDGTIESMVVGVISGEGGIVNIAAGGDIASLKATRIISGDGNVNIVAGGDITVDVKQVRSWSTTDENGVQFSAGGTVTDVRNTIRDQFIDEGEPPEFPPA